jgi:glucose-6-phosphate 1-dehydrogenase
MRTHTILLFGASGDLAMRKLIPALHEVMKSDSSVIWRLIGIAHDAITADDMMQRAQPHVAQFDEELWQKLCSNVGYVQGDFTDAAVYTKLACVLCNLIRLFFTYYSGAGFCWYYEKTKRSRGCVARHCI